MGWSWFAVKTIYRSTAVGTPNNADENYDENATLIEERIVLFRARSFREAIMKAEKEARKYSRGHHINPYGQKVSQKYLGQCDAFELFDPPEKGIEVYSSTELFGKNVLDKDICNRRLGDEIGKDPRRRKFFNRDL